VSTWLQEAAPAEEYILIVDSDMLFRRPLLPGPLGVQPGTAASQNQWCAPRSGPLPSARRTHGAPLAAAHLAPFQELARSWDQALGALAKGLGHGWNSAAGGRGAAPGTCRT